MRYISHYEEYPIYEPAEGGYYYTGNQLVFSERKSKRQCRRDFEEVWKQCQKENEENGFREDNKDEWWEITKKTHIFSWHRINDNYIIKNSYYTGEGESWCIERKQGKYESGWQPYC